MDSLKFKTMWKPERPFATNDIKGGMRRMAKDKAYDMKWIETSPSGLKNLMVLDVDLDHADWKVKDMVFEDGILPEYNFLTTNPISGHSQVGYFIDGFVSSFKAQKFFDDVYSGLKVVSGSDLLYGGRTMRNPMVASQVTEWGTDRLYSLSDLHAYCSGVAAVTGAPVASVASVEGFGRNDSTFQLLSKYAYSLFVKLKFQEKDFFEVAINERAFELNGSWNVPLPPSEVGSIARSVVKWVTREFNAKTFSDIQAARARKRWGNDGRARLVEVALMREAGFTVREVGVALGVSYEAAKSMVRRSKSV